MKRTVTTVMLVILAVVLLSFEDLLQRSANLPVPRSQKVQLLADGGAPMPPWPGTGTSLLADGGAPMPPWPPSARTRFSHDLVA